MASIDVLKNHSETGSGRTTRNSCIQKCLKCHIQSNNYCYVQTAEHCLSESFEGFLFLRAVKDKFCSGYSRLSFT